MPLSAKERTRKLRQLTASEGFTTTEELLEAAAHDSVSPGICTSDGCDYTAEVEPDQDQGWCEECRRQTVHSALMLAGLI